MSFKAKAKQNEGFMMPQNLYLRLFEPSWAILGASWSYFGPPWGYLGLFEVVLDYFGGIFGPFLEQLGAILG